MTVSEKPLSFATLSGSESGDRDPEGNRPPSSGLPMGRIVEMAFSRIWVIKRQGALTEVEGRLYWPDRCSLERAAARAGIPLSDVVIRTGRLDIKHR
ncbi:hypothetical protein [Azospirillum thiophilum]|uniref:hypothetical protein n=1 Tax=Azospirillum thiophilum TaxID=528244 RepID=UPI000AC41A0F|nr:hypothetical protein [Azospirillum thiophilum]